MEYKILSAGFNSGTPFCVLTFEASFERNDFIFRLTITFKTFFARVLGF